MTTSSSTDPVTSESSDPNDALPDVMIYVPPTGSLQPKVSGRYKRLKKFFLRKDCFYCSHNGYYIYALNEHSYGIGNRIGSSSVVVKILSDDIMVGDCVVWSEKDQDYIKFDDVDIWIDGDTNHECGEVDYAPQALHVKSKYENIHGGYIIVAQTCCERPVYFNEEAGMYMIYSGENWIITSDKNISNGFTFVAESRKTSATFPTNCTWKEGLTVNEVVNDDSSTKPESQSQSDGPNAVLPNSNNDNNSYESQFEEGFIDDQFPPAHDSVGSAENIPDNLRWFRAGSKLSHSDGPPQLFDVEEPINILEGSVSGDNWLSSAISAVAEFPGFLQSLIKEKGVNRMEGKYTVQLYDIGIGAWLDITVDDFIPCREKQWYEKRPVPIYSQPAGNEIYILILEKAFAKFAGSYTKLCNSMAPYAWTHLTGCESQEIWDLSVQEGKARKSVVSIDFRRQNPRNFQAVYTERPSDSDQQESEQDLSWDAFFSHLRTADQKNYIVAASIAPKPGLKIKDKRRPDGLVEGCTYSILEIRIIPGKNDGKKYRLLKLRNPWGASQEWMGKWSSESMEWKDQVDKKERDMFCENEYDGVFWIQYSDFLSIFTTIYISPMDMRVGRGSHKRANSITSEHFERIMQNIAMR